MNTKKLILILASLTLVSCGGEVASLSQNETSSFSSVNSSSVSVSSEAGPSSSEAEIVSSSSESSVSSRVVSSSSEAQELSSSSSLIPAVSSSSSSASSSSSSVSSSAAASSSSDSSSAPSSQKKTIAEIKALIAETSFDLNSAKIGIDQERMFTVEGLAIQKFTLTKAVKKYGYNVSDPNKVVLADSTGYLVVASNDFYTKVQDYANNPDSKYSVTGYLSLYMNMPELYVPSKDNIVFDKTLSVNVDYESLPVKTESLSSFYEDYKNTPYNCAGHGYGDMIKMEGLTCFSTDASSKTAYLTDGSHFLKVIYDKEGLSKGFVYDVIGTISFKNYTAALRLVKATPVNATSASIDTSAATEMSIDSLRTHKTSQDDTDRRYEDYTVFFGGFYYADVYFGAAVENSKYYVGVADTARPTDVTGKVNAMNNGMALIANDEYWNRTESQLALYCPNNEDIQQTTPVRVYYVPDLMTYSSGKTNYKIELISFAR